MPFDLAFNRACKFLSYLSNFDPNSHMQLNKRIGIFSLLPLTWFGFNFKTAGGNVKGESCYDPTKPVEEQQVFAMMIHSKSAMSNVVDVTTIADATVVHKKVTFVII